MKIHTLEVIRPRQNQIILLVATIFQIPLNRALGRSDAADWKAGKIALIQPRLSLKAGLSFIWAVPSAGSRTYHWNHGVFFKNWCLLTEKFHRSPVSHRNAGLDYVRNCSRTGVLWKETFWRCCHSDLFMGFLPDLCWWSFSSISSDGVGEKGHLKTKWHQILVAESKRRPESYRDRLSWVPSGRIKEGMASCMHRSCRDGSNWRWQC